uniref:Uncharacterized protein n=1 Tax=Rhizophora mucronata TaxID=61149 RepID=A0A2P2K7G1_RHIMU
MPPFDLSLVQNWMNQIYHPCAFGEATLLIEARNISFFFFLSSFAVNFHL